MVTLLGPSGCGKSTTLRCVAGLESIDGGRIIIDNELVSSAEEHISIPPERRDIGMVFQSYAVWPHMSVWSNVAYPLQVHKVRKPEIADRVKEVLSVVGLADMADRNVIKLSGGQQQRVVLARALAHNPRILLLDEPLSNLGARLRVSMRFEIRQLQQKIGITSLYVTHDQSEAMVISDRVIVMNEGRIEQVDHPLEIYRKPTSAFVASFFGEVNFIKGKIAPVDEPQSFVPVEINTDEGKKILFASPQPGMRAGDRVFLCIRPQDMEPKTQTVNDKGIPSLSGKVSQIVHMGSHVEYSIDLPGHQLRYHSMQDSGVECGMDLELLLRPERCICVSR
jgi:iron(III) transport system ATP-binding protein